MAADSNSPYIMDRPMSDNKIIFDFFCNCTLAFFKG